MDLHDAWKLIKLESEAAPDLKAAGLHQDNLERLFHGPKAKPASYTGLAGMLEMDRAYQAREYLAAEQALEALTSGSWFIICPLSGQRLQCIATVALTGVPGAFVTTLLYRFEGGPEPIILVVSGLIGRVSYLLIPSLKVVVYDLNPDFAKALVNRFEADRKMIEDGFARNQIGEGPCQGVLDMVTNSAHQMINHLSGVERAVDVLRDRGLSLLVYGRSFFGPIEALFPELDGRVKPLATRQDLADAINTSGALCLRVGSNLFASNTRQRILRRLPAGSGTPVPHRFRLCVTVRGGGRRCRNLADAVGTIANHLIGHFNEVEVVVLGWSIPEGDLIHQSMAEALRDRFHGPGLDADLMEVRQIRARLPEGVRLLNGVGLGMFEAVALARTCDVYLAHAGTLQHNLGFLTNMPGVVHGPRAVLARREAGAYQCEEGLPPHFLDASAVTDVAADEGRYADYAIVDPDSLGRQLLAVVKGTRGVGSPND